MTVGTDLDRAAAQAKAAIHNHNLGSLTRLLADHPALLHWQGGDDRSGLLGFATGAYGDAFGAEREAWFTRVDAAELLIEAGAIVAPAVVEGILDSRAQGLLQLFDRKELLPSTLNFSAALGDVDAVRAALEAPAALISEAFVVATNFHHPPAASLLLDRLVELDADLRAQIDRGPGRAAFIKYFIDHGAVDRKRAAIDGLWKTFAMRHVKDALTNGDLPAFIEALERNRWLLADQWVSFQVDLIGWAATINDREDFLRELLDRDPAVLRRQPRPDPKPIAWAFEYGHTSLLPLLTRIWPVPDELPFAAGLGNVPRINEWFATHDDTSQEVLDTALAYAISNRQFTAADLVIAKGANIDTTWNTHEPASLLHHAVFLDDYEILQFLIDRGIDMTIEDYRWGATARGWARYAKNDEKMAAWLEERESRADSA